MKLSHVLVAAAASIPLLSPSPSRAETLSTPLKVIKPTTVNLNLNVSTAAQSNIEVNGALAATTRFLRITEGAPTALLEARKNKDGSLTLKQLLPAPTMVEAMTINGAKLTPPKSALLAPSWRFTSLQGISSTWPFKKDILRGTIATATNGVVLQAISAPQAEHFWATGSRLKTDCYLGSVARESRPMGSQSKLTGKCCVAPNYLGALAASGLSPEILMCK